MIEIKGIVTFFTSAIRFFKILTLNLIKTNSSNKVN